MRKVMRNRAFRGNEKASTVETLWPGWWAKRVRNGNRNLVRLPKSQFFCLLSMRGNGSNRSCNNLVECMFSHLELRSINAIFFCCSNRHAIDKIVYILSINDSPMMWHAQQPFQFPHEGRRLGQPFVQCGRVRCGNRAISLQRQRHVLGMDPMLFEPVFALQRSQTNAN